MVRRVWDGRTSGREVPTEQGLVPGEMFLSSRAASHLAPVPSIVILERGRREGGGREEGGRREGGEREERGRREGGRMEERGKRERERRKEREERIERKERGRTGRKGERGARGEIC